LLRGGRRLLRAGEIVTGRYLAGRRRGTAAEARLAEAMVSYAKLCLTAGKTPRDLEEAATYLDKAADLYIEIGRPEEAAEARALKPGAGARIDASRG